MNKNVLIALLAVIIAVLAFVTFRPKEEIESVSPTVVIPTSQTTTINNPSAADYQQQQQNPVITNTQNIAGWKTYTTSNYSFQYPSNTSVTKTTAGNGQDVITIKVPLITPYKVVSKGIYISDMKVTCSERGSSTATDTKTINGITYFYADPEWTATSGMSSVNKERTYYYELNGNCYMISEYISMPGNNERSPNEPIPKDFDSFINAELPILDQIVSTIKFE